MTQQNGRRGPEQGTPDVPREAAGGMVAPQDLEAEERVLGGLLLAGGDGIEACALAVKQLRDVGLEPSDFYRSSHAKIYAAAIALVDCGEACEAGLVVGELERRKQLEDVGGRVRLSELAALATARSNVAAFARRVREKARRNDEAITGIELQRVSADGGLSANPNVAARITRLLEEADLERFEDRSRKRKRVYTYAELLEEYEEERRTEASEPVRLGFGTIDAELRGISAGQVLGVAARTGVGKTWVLNSVLESTSARRDSGSLTLSLEMPGPEWAERQLAVSLGVPPEQVEQWARSGELAERSRPFLERMEHALLVDEPVRLEEIGEVLTEARHRLSVPVRLLAIDYLGLLQTSGRDAYERASNLGKGLKFVAKQERVAVVVAMQLSRAAGDGSEPVTLDMLRDSGVLEESLDFLLGAWRPEKARGLNPAESEDVRDLLRVAILKNRKGKDGRVVDLRFRAKSRRVYEPSLA